MKKFIYGIAGAAIVAAAVMHYEDADASDNKRENKTDSAASTLINPGENPLRSYRINTQRDTVLHIR
mgnify:FL=1